MIACLLLVLGTRFHHLAGPIDDPHSPRQCDTANYAYAFYAEGIDLLHPSVCWMGSHKTVIMEFPFPEAVMAVAYKFFGPHLAVARVCTLLFFWGSAVYLFFIVRLLFGDRAAYGATLIYLFLPLARFYSRAVHIDFYAVFFAHAMTYHFLRGFERVSHAHYAAGMLAGFLGFLIKAPYLFYFILPLTAWLLPRFDWKKYLVFLAYFTPPAAAFVLWRVYATAVNLAAPDWFFIPNHFKMVSMYHWYFGDLAQRFSLKIWHDFLQRNLFDLFIGPGLLLTFLGIVAVFLFGREYGRSAVRVLWAWTAGLLLYLLVFFNLNVVHNYYQIPFLALVSVWMALGLDLLRRCVPRSDKPWRDGIPFWLALAVLVLHSGSYAEKVYYQVDHHLVDAGKIVRARTPTDALIVFAYDDGQTVHGDPRGLFRAGRNGWSISGTGLNRDLLAKYGELGAAYLALVTPRTGQNLDLYGYRAQVFDLSDPAWKLYLARLDLPE